MVLVTLTVLTPASATLTDEPLLSATDPGYAFVERIQQTYCNRNPSHNCGFDPAECRDQTTKLWREMFGEPPPPETLKRSCDKVSTRFELPGTFWLLNTLYSEVREVAPQVGLPQLEDVHLGSLPIREVNARVLPSDPALGHFLFFNTRFFEFASELAKVAALSIPMKVENEFLVIDGSEESLEKNLKGNREIRFLFINRLMHFLNVEGMKPATPPRNIQPILSVYQQGIELFAMAHEYSHIALKHAGAAIALEGMDLPASALGISGPSGNWAQELEADFYAAKILRTILMRRLSKKDPLMAEYMLVATPQFYFLARQILNEAHDIFFGDGQLRPKSVEEPRFLKIAIDCAKKNTCRLVEVLGQQSGLPMGHPNSVIRRDFARTILQDDHKPRNETERAMITVASLMVRNIDYLWNDASTKLRSPEAAELIKLVRDKRPK